MPDPRDHEADIELRDVIRRGRIRSARESAATWVPVLVGAIVFVGVMSVMIGGLQATDTGSRGTGRIAIVVALVAASFIGGLLRKLIKPKPLE